MFENFSLRSGDFCSAARSAQCSAAQRMIFWNFRNAVGNPVFGIVSDRIGRQKTLLLTTFSCVVCLILSGTRFVEDIFWYSIIRFLSGFFDAGLTVSQVGLILSC